MKSLSFLNKMIKPVQQTQLRSFSTAWGIKSKFE